MLESGLAALAAPLMSVVKAAWGPARRLYHERQTGQAPAAFDNDDFLEKNFDETLGRLCKGRVDDAWWRALLKNLGHQYVAPEFLRKPALQDWLAKPRVQDDTKALARRRIMSDDFVDPDALGRLRQSYALSTGEHTQLADGPIDVVVAVLVVGFLSGIEGGQEPLAGMIQALGRDTRGEFQRLSEDLKAEPPLIAPHASRRTMNNRLHYAHQIVEFVGRQAELAELTEFLAPCGASSGADFAWWLWTAPGGQGKSRLAFQLCKTYGHNWRCGFLSTTPEFEQWDKWVVDQPTLMVVDHVAYRAKQIGKAIVALARSVRVRAPLRVLVLERPLRRNDKWIEAFVPKRFSEDYEDFFASAHIQAGRPATDLDGCVRPLGPLCDDDLWRIIEAVLGETKVMLDRTTALALLAGIDPLRRPLFAVLGAEAIRAAGVDRIRQWNRDDLVEFILRRDFDLWRATLRVADEFAPTEKLCRQFEAHLNLVTIATIAGRSDIDFLETLSRHSVAVPDRPQPDWLRTMTGYSEESAVDDTLPPLAPDILGELFVLERLSGGFGLDSNERVPLQQTKQLLDIALAYRSRGAIDFIVRCISDFPDHSALERFAEIDIPEGDTASYGHYEGYVVAMDRVAGALAEAKKWDLASRCYTRIIDRGRRFSGLGGLSSLRDHRIAGELYNRAVCYCRQEGKNGMAKADCDAAIDLLDGLLLKDAEDARLNISTYQMLELRCGVLKLRGGLRVLVGDTLGALSDMDRALEDARFDAQRAEVLLKRILIYENERNDAAAISDCEAVLDIGDHVAEDVRELATDTLIPSLGREAHRFWKAENLKAAMQCFDRLINVSRGRPRAHALARVDRSILKLLLGEVQPAIEDCTAVLDGADSPPDQQLKALNIRASGYLRLDRYDLAGKDLKRILHSSAASLRDKNLATLNGAQLQYMQDDRKGACEGLQNLALRDDMDADLQELVARLLSQWCR